MLVKKHNGNIKFEHFVFFFSCDIIQTKLEVYMENIDIERLRSDLKSFLGSGVIIGGYGGMIDDYEKIDNASLDTLIEIANQYNVPIEDYIIYQRIR